MAAAAAAPAAGHTAAFAARNHPCLTCSAPGPHLAPIAAADMARHTAVAAAAPAVAAAGHTAAFAGQRRTPLNGTHRAGTAGLAALVVAAVAAQAAVYACSTEAAGQAAGDLVHVLAAGCHTALVAAQGPLAPHPSGLAAAAQAPVDAGPGPAPAAAQAPAGAARLHPPHLPLQRSCTAAVQPAVPSAAAAAAAACAAAAAVLAAVAAVQLAWRRAQPPAWRPCLVSALSRLWSVAQAASSTQPRASFARHVAGVRPRVPQPASWLAHPQSAHKQEGFASRSRHMYNRSHSCLGRYVPP